MKKIREIFSIQPLIIFLKKISLIPEYYWYFKDYLKLKKLSKQEERFPLSLKNRQIHLEDKTMETPFDPHYIYHPVWAAEILAETKPKKHIDISSTLHFSTILSAFIPTDFYDLRPANLSIKNLKTKKANLTSLPFKSSSIDSLSCMHTVEHIGLGRYGDTIDPSGDIKAIKELTRVVSKGGNLLFVVPVGKPKIAFNAHRIYSYKQIHEYFKGFTLNDFTLIADNGDYIKNAHLSLIKNQNFGCGCFWFIKN